MGKNPALSWANVLSSYALREQVDVYSFGVVLWELWTGKEPYEGLNYHALLHQITTSKGGLRPTLPSSSRWEGDPCPEPAPGWEKLVERCWQDCPDSRPAFDEVRPAAGPGFVASGLPFILQ